MQDVMVVMNDSFELNKKVYIAMHVFLIIL